MGNFDEATKNAMALAEADAIEQAPEATEEAVGEIVSDEEQQIMDVTENAVATAENAATVAQQKSVELENVTQELNQQKQINAQLSNQIQQMSEQAQQSVVDQTVPSPTPPTIDFDSLVFADEATRNEILASYNNDVIDYQKSNIMRELDPFIKEAKRGATERETKEIYSELSRDARFADIESMSGAIENVIANNPRLFGEDMPLDEKLVTAYTIVKGANAINNPIQPSPEPTARELFELYKSNPELQELIEQSRIEQLKESQQVPNMAASSGVANAALTIKEKPKTIRDAGIAARKLFGIN